MFILQLRQEKVKILQSCKKEKNVYANFSLDFLI